VLDLLLSPLYAAALAPEHRTDLAKSGLTDDTIRQHRLMSVPPDLIPPLLALSEAPLRDVRSALLIPFPHPVTGWMRHVRVKVFPSLVGLDGHTVRYLGPKGWPPRLYFPISATPAVLNVGAALWLCEGAKKALALAQLGFPAVGFEGIEGWHAKGTTALLPDFALIPMSERVVELVPDGDVQTNPDVRRGAERLAVALATRGARPRLVRLPRELAA
jgi:hypothetical protein